MYIYIYISIYILHQKQVAIGYCGSWQDKAAVGTIGW